ncbi:MAG: SUMF1/EgtB/PvdO family nonheme iron enzyme [Terriglobia bacterium]
MKRLWIIIVLLAVLLGGGLFSWRYLAKEREEQAHFERAETMLIVSNLAQVPLTLFQAGKNLDDAKPVDGFEAMGTWLKSGNYYLKAQFPSGTALYPIAIPGYRSGPDADGNFTLTIRTPPAEIPPKPSPAASDFTYIPPGPVLLGDRLNPREPHFVWIPGFFISPFEVSNQDFKMFWEDPHGYSDDQHWTEGGKRWKQANPCRATALLKAEDKDFRRFGGADQPVVSVNWFEADAFCQWLTWKYGKGKWIFSLPTEAEWEKAARGPDNFDYALGASISDREVPYYNWKKNPSAEVTVIGSDISRHQFLPNRYGLYHMTGNVSEWTQTLNRPYNREHPYADDDRNRSDLPGTRVVRGGSWYTASTAVLYIPYRETFQPEVSAPYLGFRVTCRLPPLYIPPN